jgi:hypothetical protein
MIKNTRKKKKNLRKKIRQTNFSPLHILGHTDAAQLQCLNTDAVMITADILAAPTLYQS